MVSNKKVDTLEQPLISVIMPAFNAGKYIAEAISSILNQTHKNFELLICDDGSTDNTIEVIQSFQDARIQLFRNNKNIGNLKTSNFLFQKCQGEFITIQDADDWSLDQRLEKQLEELINDAHLGLIGVNYMLVDENKNPIRCGLFPLSDDEIKKEMKNNLPPFLCAGIMVRKSICNQTGYYRLFFNRIGSADYDWVSRISEITKVKNLHTIYYIYRINPTSFTKTSQPNNFLKLYSEKVVLFLMKQRQTNPKDALEAGKKREIYSFVCNVIRQESEKLFWSNKYQESIMKAKLALRISFFSIENWRLFLYIYRHILLKK